MEAETDEQAVASNFHLIRLNGLRRREDAQGYLQFGGLVPRNRREARVVEGRAARGFGNGAIERRHREDIADAAPQAAAIIKSSESAARLGQMRGRRSQCDGALIEGCGNGLMSEPQQQAALGREKIRLG